MTNIENNDKPAAVAEQGANTAPEPAASNNDATQKKAAAKARKTAKGARTKAAKTTAAETKAAVPKKVKGKGTARKTAKETSKETGKKAAASTHAKAAGPRAESKGAKILEMIGRPKGATLAEIMKATDWQAHSVRGFISTGGKKHGIEIESSKNEAGDRVYRIVK